MSAPDMAQTAPAPVMPVPRFNIGDTAFHAFTVSSGSSFPCPDCNGTGKWKALSPTGVEAPITCPRCDGRGKLVQHGFTGSVRRLTIGQIRIEWPKAYSLDDSPVSYMAKETGIGSGNIYYEQTLFASQDDAEAAAKRKADATNRRLDKEQPERVRRRELYSYGIEQALKSEADDGRRKAEQRFERLLNRVLELDTYPTAHRINSDGNETDDYLSGSLEQDQVTLVQNNLLHGDKAALVLLADYRREAA